MTMRGGEVFMASLVAHGVRAIFGNPGTTENSVLDRLIDFPELEYYVALHEGVALGAATFYAHASGQLGVVNLHVAPGLGNAIGMIYGALKSNAPVLVTAGQQDTRMRMRAPILSHDLVAMAAPVTKFSAEAQSADELADLIRRAIKTALEPPCGPVFLALPVNVMEQETNASIIAASAPAPSFAGAQSIDAAAALIAGSRKPCIITGDDPARDGAFDELVALAETLGAAVFNEGLRTHLSFPSRHPNYCGRIPFASDELQKLLSDYDLVILAGGPFFEDVWYSDCSPIPPNTKVLQIENNASRLAQNFPVDVGVHGDLADLLGRLGALLQGQGFDATMAARRNAEFKEAAVKRNNPPTEQTPTAKLSAPQALAEIAALTPKNTIIVDESITAFSEVMKQFDIARPGDYFAGRGGGIGQGVAGALGVQVAQRDNRVMVISGDGSSMYSCQAFWTAAHHDLPIVFIILANREYRVLKHNLDTYRRRFDIASEKPYPHMDLNKPEIDFVSIAKGMGVDGACVHDVKGLRQALNDAFSSKRAYLIEVIVAGAQT